jgi:phosphohistidine phosphatase
MELYLMQHGASLPKELDPEQGLSTLGREQIEKSGRAARLLVHHPDVLLASPKKRSLQSAEILAQALGYPVKRIMVTEAVKAMTPALDTLHLLRSLHEEHDVRNVLIAGHMPSIGELISLVITSDARAAVHIENGGLARVDILDFARPAGTLLWYLTPQQLGLIATD